VNIAIDGYLENQGGSMQTQQGRPIIEGWDNLIRICKVMEKIDDDRQNIDKINQTMNYALQLKIEKM
jgi:hypothetical protein